MTVLLLCLLAMYQRLGIGRRQVRRSDKLAVHLPISVYLGWISLAIIANIASVLNVLIPGIPMYTQTLWTVVVLLLVTVITILMVWNRRDFAFGLVVIWASIGIALNRVAIPIISSISIATCAIVTILLLITPFLKKTSFTSFYMMANSQ
jgi:hypothetical protein